MKKEQRLITKQKT